MSQPFSCFTSSTAADLLTAEESLTLVRENLSETDWRIVFLWASGYTQKDIATMYNVSQQAVSKRVRQICASLRTRLGDVLPL
jgi:DNA-binding NarL/FixJ family response regulator